MATTITAGNATNGAAIASDNTGILELKTGTGSGTTAITADASQNVTIAGGLTVTGAFSGATPIQPITASVAGNALTVTLNPTTLAFRSSTLSSGTVNTRNVANAISMTVSSGSTLGTVNNVASRIVVLAIDNAGTVELAVVNLAGGNQLDETNLISTTAEGGAGAADSNNVIYSTTARSNVPYRVVGFIDSTQTTAGTWASAPTTIQGVGGQALAALSSLGFGQTWQTVTASRALATTYYNTTGKPIEAIISSGGASGTAVTLRLSINGGTAFVFAQCNLPSGNSVVAGGFIVPANASYAVTQTGSATLVSWNELR